MTARHGILAGISVVLAVALTVAFLTRLGRQSGLDTETDHYTQRPAGAVTYSRDIAPIFFRHCAVCHRPGEAGPFPLLNYADGRSHASQIADVVRRRIMPPWLPDPHVVTFTGQRVLSATEIGLICQWADEGAAEGDPADVPARPEWVEGWQLGQPDMIVKFPEPFLLPAGGGDVFRNFVIPVALNQRQYVRAVEIRPENPRTVHHGVLLIDTTAESRRLDQTDTAPGFGGMIYGRSAHSPDGHFIGWTPGKMPFQAPDDMAWELEPGTDFVLQLHLLPGGKPEPVDASIGLFFSDRPPRKRPLVLRIGSLTIDISPGDADYRIREQFRLPVDVELLSVYPHAHYLGRRIQGDIVHPDGVRQPLIRIAEWDFRWQDEYRLPTPIPVQKGASLSMEFSFDNSEENVRNPSHPPRRVTFGPQSSDEMGDLWVQVLAGSERDRDILKSVYGRKDYEARLKGALFEVELHPEDFAAQYNLACMLEENGALDAAEAHYSHALRLNPAHAESMNNLGVVFCRRGRFAEAIPLLEKTLQLRPDLEDAIHNLDLARAALRPRPENK